MPAIDVYNLNREKTGTMALADTVFDVEVREHLFHEAVRAQMAAKRSGTAKVKERGEIVGSTAKVYRQKGTGRARQGDKKGNHCVGGGVAHGPRPRAYNIKVNKKTRRAALCAALSRRQQEGRLVVLMDAIKGDKWQGLEDMIKLGRFSATHYAWGWSFIHFLMSNKRYSSRFQRFYIALGTGKGIKRVPYQGDMKQCKPEEVIRGLKAYLGVKDLKQLEKQWHAYVKKQKLKTHRGYEDAAQWAERWGLTIRAGRYYRTAIEKGTKNPLTFDNYGEWLVSKNRPAEAVKKFEKAIELDPMNAYFHLHLGRALISTGDAAGGKKRKKLALELAPNDAWLEYMAR